MLPNRFSERLTRGGDFARVRKNGRTLRTSGIELLVSPSLFEQSRLGLIVPKYGHSAVQRNQLKRRLREIVRTRELPARTDAVLLARPGAYQLAFDVLRDRVQHLFVRAGGPP